jgi:hypothetical protein
MPMYAGDASTTCCAWHGRYQFNELRVGLNADVFRGFKGGALRLTTRSVPTLGDALRNVFLDDRLIY